MKNYVIKLIVVSLLAVVSISLVGCNLVADSINSNETTFSTEARETLCPIADFSEEFSVETVMLRSTHIIDAVYVGINEKAKTTELVFAPEKTVKGVLDNSDQEAIYVIPTKRVAFTEDSYRVGEKYMLCVQKNISVYYEHNKYVQCGDLIISYADERWNYYHQIAQNVIEEAGNTTPNEFGIPFCDSSKPEDVIDFSSNIYIVEVKSVYAESTIEPTTVYNCEVKKIIKGNMIDNNHILLTLFNGTADIGNEYIVLLSDAADTSSVYCLASRSGSIYKLEEAAMIDCLAKIISAEE